MEEEKERERRRKSHFYSQTIGIDKIGTWSCMVTATSTSLSLSLEADSFKSTYSPQDMVQNRWTSSLAQLFPKNFCENKYQEELL